MQQLIRFVLVGIFNTLYGFAIIFACMYWLGLNPITSNIIGYCVGLVTSYLLNKFFTFRSPARSAGEAIRFLVVFAVAYLANLALLLACIEMIGLDKGISQLVAGIAYVGVSFLLNKYYVFRYT